jgi:adhesin transport system outer membrane protein
MGGENLRQVNRALVALAAATVMSGCMAELPSFTKKPAQEETTKAALQDGSFQQVTGDNQSVVIETLLERKSILKSGPYNTVADAALNASARASEAKLRSAKLRAEAQSKNWLPTIGPNISLTSLGDLVAGILVEQVLFDNGRRKAEREFAAADVEVAAVNLSIDMNDRVYTALSLYLSGLRGDEKANLSARALSRMHEFERIVIGRVNGGVSDSADQRVVESKISDMRADQSTSTEAATTARAELQAMTGQMFETKPTLFDLDIPQLEIEALEVLKSSAEATRSVAQATVSRAGLLPSLTASANVTDSGTTGGIGLGTSQPIGFGTGAHLKAIEATKETSRRQVAEASETARRNESRLRQRLVSFRRQEAEAAKLAKSSGETFRLFERQFEAGQRTVIDVIAIYEQLVQREQAHVDAKYEVILIQLELARDLGLLADGDSI